MKVARLTSFCIILILIFACSRSIKGTGKSLSKGKVNKGSLENGRRFPYKGENFKYFSPMSFTLFNRAWVHEKVLKSTIEAYEECNKQDSSKKYLLMECSEKHGGKMFPHRTHQNGTSIDFGTPLIKNGKPFQRHHNYGVFHYTMKFDESGVWKGNKNVKIDFETMANHILVLDKKARKNGMYIKKVIFKIDLKDDLFKTDSGKKLKRKKIYFAQRLSPLIDNLHDDHYHVDFGFLK